MRSLITAPRLFTGLDHTFIDRGAVLVERDRSWRPEGKATLGSSNGPVARFHIPDGTIVPGLIDGHTHLTCSASDRMVADAFEDDDRPLPSAPPTMPTPPFGRASPRFATAAPAIAWSTASARRSASGSRRGRGCRSAAASSRPPAATCTSSAGRSTTLGAAPRGPGAGSAGADSSRSRTPEAAWCPAMAPPTSSSIARPSA